MIDLQLNMKLTRDNISNFKDIFYPLDNKKQKHHDEYENIISCLFIIDSEERDEDISSIWNVKHERKEVADIMYDPYRFPKAIRMFHLGKVMTCDLLH